MAGGGIETGEPWATGANARRADGRWPLSRWATAGGEKPAAAQPGRRGGCAWWAEADACPGEENEGRRFMFLDPNKNLDWIQPQLNARWVESNKKKEWI